MLDESVRVVEELKLDSQIPFDEYPADGPRLHFAHANGYPPAAYRPLIDCLNQDYHIYAMHQRPLWPGTDPDALQNWEPLADDLSRFLDEQDLHAVIGIGHSVGGNATLRLALRQPDRFSAVILIDPVIFPPKFIPFWKMIYASGQAYRLHPLASAALRRRRVFPDRESMFANYRQKEVFRRIDEAGLWAYVHAITRDRPDGQVELVYPPEWEARIYVTGILSDQSLWQVLPGLIPPLFVIRGEQTDTFRESALLLIQKKLPTAAVVNLPQAGHLVPLEKPGEVCRLIKQFLIDQHLL